MSQILDTSLIPDSILDSAAWDSNFQEGVDVQGVRRDVCWVPLYMEDGSMWDTNLLTHTPIY